MIPSLPHLHFTAMPEKHDCHWCSEATGCGRRKRSWRKCRPYGHLFTFEGTPVHRKFEFHQICMGDILSMHNQHFMKIGQAIGFGDTPPVYIECICCPNSLWDLIGSRRLAAEAQDPRGGSVHRCASGPRAHSSTSGPPEEAVGVAGRHRQRAANPR